MYPAALLSVATTSASMQNHSFNCRNRRRLGHARFATRQLLTNISKLTSPYPSRRNPSLIADIYHRYVDNILRSTPKSIDQVTIEPTGNWFQTLGSAPSPAPTSNERANSDGEEEIVEIRDISRLTSVKNESTGDSGLMRTPPVSSREQSILSAPPTSTSGNKRSAGQVVDLTVSSDEDDEPPRVSKLQRSSTNSSRILGIENVPVRPNGGARQHSSNPFNMTSHPPKINNPLPRQ